MVYGSQGNWTSKYKCYMVSAFNKVDQYVQALHGLRKLGKWMSKYKCYMVYGRQEKWTSKYKCYMVLVLNEMGK